MSGRFDHANSYLALTQHIAVVQVAIVCELTLVMRENRRAGQLFQNRRRGRMIGVAVREQQHRDRAAHAGRASLQRGNVPLDKRSGIDADRPAVTAVDEVTVRPGQRHRRRIRRANE